MTPIRPSSLANQPVDIRVVLSGLWVAILFVFAYVDIFGFWRADVLQGALASRVPGPGLAVDQAFLLKTTVYALVPSLMVVVSLLAPARVNRPLNVITSLLYAVSVVLSVVGETWAYYVLGSVVETVLLLAIAKVAFAWPRRAFDEK